MDKKFTVSAEELRKLYEEEKLSMAQIGEKFGVCSITVLQRFKKLGIPRRGKREGTLIRFLPRRKYKGSLEELKRMYLKEKLSCRQIGEKLGITRGTVNYYLKEYGIKMRGIREGQKTRWPKGRYGKEAANWRGGKVLSRGSRGYTMIHKPDHPHANPHGYVMEHRLVMEEKLGRYLEKNEIVHHINDNPVDNRPENLEVVSRSAHVHNHFAKGKYVMALEEEIKQLKTLINQLQSKILPTHGA